MPPIYLRMASKYGADFVFHVGLWDSWHARNVDTCCFVLICTPPGATDWWSTMLPAGGRWGPLRRFTKLLAFHPHAISLCFVCSLCRQMSLVEDGPYGANHVFYKCSQGSCHSNFLFFSKYSSRNHCGGLEWPAASRRRPLSSVFHIIILHKRNLMAFSSVVMPSVCTSQIYVCWLTITPKRSVIETILVR